MISVQQFANHSLALGRKNLSLRLVYCLYPSVSMGSEGMTPLPGCSHIFQVAHFDGAYLILQNGLYPVFVLNSISLLFCSLLMNGFNLEETCLPVSTKEQMNFVLLNVPLLGFQSIVINVHGQRVLVY